MPYSFTIFDDEVGEIYAVGGRFKSASSAFEAAKSIVRKDVRSGKLTPDVDKAIAIEKDGKVIEQYEGTAVLHYLELPKNLLDRIV